MKIGLIKPYPRNAKAHPKKQVEQIANSITLFGFNQPIVLDKNNVIIVGHGRYEAAKLLKLKDVPTITVKLSDEEAKAYRLADNKLNESDWDMELVIEQLKELSMPMLDATGFDRDLILNIKEPSEPTVPTAKARTHIGDVYELTEGDITHRLVCGDSASPDVVKELMLNQRANMIFTDPPYNVDYSYDKYDAVRKKRKNVFKDSGHIIGDNFKTAESFKEFLTKVFKNAYDFTTDEAPIYVCHATKTQAQFFEALDANDWHYSQTIIWLKERILLTMGQDYHRIYEPIFFGWKKKHKHFSSFTVSNSSEFWTLDKETFEQQLDVWKIKRDNSADYRHPTQKPIRLPARAITKSAPPHGLVLDFFGGSGSTMLGCHATGRSCMTIELDPIYCDVIVQRFVDYAENPKVLKNGKTDSWMKTKVDEEQEPQGHGGSLKRTKKRVESTDDDEPEAE